MFAVIDPGVEAQFGIAATLRSLEDGCDVTSFTDFSPNPCWESLETAASAACSAGARCVIAIGGGTAIDLGKLVALALQLGGVDHLWDAIGCEETRLSERPDIRLMAIPTTAGTGAEATQFAVLYRNSRKHSVAGNALMPDTYALDPSLLASLPSSVIADAGLDAACQAMESLWSVRTSPESEEFAWAALDLAIMHLERAVTTSDHTSLGGMLVAAHLSGKAINLTTTTAPHALSYGLTSLLGVPHGRAVAFLFGSIFKLNTGSPADDCRHPKGQDFLRHRLEEIAKRWGQTCEGFPCWWQKFVHESLQIPALSVENWPELMEPLVMSVNATRLANNPRSLSSEEIREVYQTLARSDRSRQ